MKPKRPACTRRLNKSSGGCRVGETRTSAPRPNAKCSFCGFCGSRLGAPPRVPSSEGVQKLGAHPWMGRTIEDLPDAYREWLIGFGDSGYVARYRIDGEVVTILAVRHQKEAGF